jgi:hypothetical protein
MQDKVRSGVSEDRFTGAIESQTSKIPSSGYLAAAFGAITASAILKIVRKDDWALFCGTVASGISINGRLQQNGKAARFRYIQQGRLRVTCRGCLRNRGHLASAAEFLNCLRYNRRSPITQD